MSVAALLALASLSCAPTPPGAPIGAAAPTRVVEAASNRSWVALCQAREDTDGDGELVPAYSCLFEGNDEMRPYFVLGSGEGRRFDIFLGASADERWVAFTDDGALNLVDTDSGTTYEPESCEAVALTQPMDAFDPAGEHYLVVRGPGSGHRMSRIDLASGEEVPIDFGGGYVIDARFADNTDFLDVWVIDAEPEEPGRRCTCVGERYPDWWGPFDYTCRDGACEQRVVSVLHGPVPYPVIAVAAPGALARQNGVLVWSDGVLTRPALPVPEDGTVIAVAPAGGLLLLERPGSDGRSDVTWWSPDLRRVSTGFRATAGDRLLDVEDGVVKVPGIWDDAGLVDMATGGHLSVADETSILEADGARVWVHDDYGDAVVDLGAGEAVRAQGPPAPRSYGPRGGRRDDGRVELAYSDDGLVLWGRRDLFAAWGPLSWGPP